jgi:hypothetical protein
MQLAYIEAEGADWSKRREDNLSKRWFGNYKRPTGSDPTVVSSMSNWMNAYVLEFCVRT